MIARYFIALALFSLSTAAVGTEQQQPIQIKPGRYVPELHGGMRGIYTPDNSGKYRHVPRPYDGGYGDRGLPYANDFREIYKQQLSLSQSEPQEFKLGPHDHLRFMIDFNLNGTGWQIVKFEWVRDDEGEQQRQYNYVNENKLWDTQPADEQQYDYEQPQSAKVEPAPADEQPATHVHVVGEADQHQSDYQVNYSDNAAQQAKTSSHNVSEIRATIHEVLEYIQKSILPTLN